MLGYSSTSKCIEGTKSIVFSANKKSIIIIIFGEFPIFESTESVERGKFQMKPGIRKTASLTIAIMSAVFLAKPAGAETVFLKNGEIIEGRASSFSNDSIQIQTDDKKVIKVKNSNILRTLYTKLKKNKVFIQKRDGEAVIGFVVDEDQDDYTVRKELYKSEEFKLAKADILFMAEKNPSGLKAVEILPEKVSLIWLPPYDVVKKYNVYIKTDPNGQYELAGNSKEKKIIIDKLKSNTTYYMIVTGVDKDDYESTPSNMITVNTKNIKPDTPANIAGLKNTSGGTVFRWDPAEDPDGKVVKYKIYITRSKTRELLTDVTATEYTFTGALDFYSAELVSVDHLGEESLPAKLPVYGEHFTTALYPGVTVPLGKFGKITGIGYGLTGSFSWNNYFFENLVIGAEAGFYSFKGKDALASEYKKSKSAYMATLLATAGYSFPLGDRFTIMPYLGAGMGLFSVKYTSRDRITLVDTNESLTDFGPILSGGVAAGYQINDAFSVTVRLHIGTLLGADSSAYAGVDAGCIYRL